MRSLRLEFLSIASVLSLPTAICLSFPFESLKFKATNVSTECVPSAAFVILSSDEEKIALLAAKTTWQSDESTGQRMRIRLPLSEIPDESDASFLDVKTGPLMPEPFHPLPYNPPAWMPSQKASDPVRVPHIENSNRGAFSREELLKLN